MQIELYDLAIRAIGALDEPARDNPVAARMQSERARLVASGMGESEAALAAGHRIFGSKPGAYGAGLQALIDEKGWTRRDDLAAPILPGAAMPMAQTAKAKLKASASPSGFRGSMP